MRTPLRVFPVPCTPLLILTAPMGPQPANPVERASLYTRELCVSHRDSIWMALDTILI